jgi:membrane protein DedA with SNARE-associated domain
VTAGLLKIPWRRWLLPLILAETIWTGTLVLIGYYTTEAIKRIEQGVEYAVLIVSILFVSFLIFEGRRLVKQWDKDESAE